MDLELGKNYKITWLDNGFVQYKRLVSSLSEHKTYYSFTVDSPIYNAILDDSFCFNLGYGKHCFKIELEKYG
jgi:hypothetical protein